MIPESAPYAKAAAQDLISRDYLAIHRTVMANERTLLAYVRTALTLFLVGITFIHLPGLHPDPAFGGLTYALAGWVFMAAAVAVGAAGYVRYRGFRARILEVERRA